MNDEEPTAWAEHLGPCYMVAGMAQRLEWTETDVLEGGNDLTLLMLPADDEDVHLFPRGPVQGWEVLGRFDEILIIFQTMTEDRWMWAFWLTTAPPGDSSLEEIERIRNVSTEVAFHGMAHNWWRLTDAETAEADDRDG